MAGTLEKRRPDGLGLLWQRRFFRLTPRTLCYFRSDADTRAHAQLGQLELADVIAVQIDAGSAEFVVGARPAHLGLPLFVPPSAHVSPPGAVLANSERAPYTLKAESPDDALEWVGAIRLHSPRIH